ncbi:MAG: hypothetical protein GXN91_04850 [Epsilonproteobacteria bacterium]|nr:hypothetical protein [Campylobacterota bacterium]
MRKLLIFFFAIALLNSAPLDRLAKRGKKVINLFCEPSKLPKDGALVEELVQKIKESNACEGISDKDIKAVATYLLSKNHHHSTQIDVPKDAKCPVCGMFVAKYPRWAAVMEIDGKKFYFDGVKDMMKYYIFDGDFKYNREKISKMEVTNYYTLEPIDAKKAFYVIGSNIYGPMGNELIPFSTLDEAKNFLKEHNGKKIIKFNEITPKLVLSLDGVEYNQ